MTGNISLEARLSALLGVYQQFGVHDHDHDGHEEGDCEPVRIVCHRAVKSLDVLAQNLAFLIRGKDDSYGRPVGPNDIFVIVLNWDGYSEGIDDATLAVLVRTTKTTKVLQVRVEPKEKVLEKLAKEVDKMLLKAMLLS